MASILSCLSSTASATSSSDKDRQDSMESCLSVFDSWISVAIAAVVIGLVLEYGPGFSRRLNAAIPPFVPKLGAVLVILGVASELGLHVLSSQTVSAIRGIQKTRDGMQQERIETLNKQTAVLQLDLEREKEKRGARILKKAQYDILQELKGKIRAINITWGNDIESSAFAHQIIIALMNAGIDVKIYMPAADIKITGIFVFKDNMQDIDSDPLLNALHRADLYGGNGV